MRLLLVSGAYAPASGGSEISAQTLLAELARRGHEAMVLTRPRPPGPWPGDDGDEPVAVVRCREGEVEAAFRSAVARFQPDVVLTQLLWSERTMLWAREAELATVLFVRSAGGEIDLSVGGPYRPTKVIANSTVTRDFVWRRWGRESTVVAPLIRFAECIATDRADPSLITMFNPTREKGGHIFRAVAERMPSRRFLAVEGWHNWKDGRGGWDREMLEAAGRGYGTASVKVPELVGFEGLDNVTLQPSTPDVRGVYAFTRVLLVPSVWPEPYARVIVEAMSNAIPVLYSGRGSTAEAADGAGTVVTPAEDPGAWVKAIRDLDDPDVYDELASRSSARARRYDLAAEVDKAEAVILKASADAHSPR